MVLVKMILKCTILLFFIYACLKVESAKILGVFPTPSVSHQAVFRKITEELVKRGHEVTVITPNPAYPKGEAPKNLKEIDVQDVSDRLQEQGRETGKEVMKMKKMDQMRLGFLFLTHVFISQIQTPEVQELINNKNNKFDLILIESVIRPALIFSHIFKAPVILVCSVGGVLNNHEIMGSPTHPLLYPSPLRERIYNLSLVEKLQELYTHYSIQYAIHLNALEEEALLKKNFGSEIPSLTELYNNVDMLLVNVNSLWADNQPVPPGVVFMGGIHQLPKKDLPKDLKTYLDSSKHGVIYVSFGTNALSMFLPPKLIEVIVKILSQMPYDVLWKWDKDELPGKSDNIKIAKWLPQSDLLRHPKIKLFVMQGGLQSTDEAITAGVPLVCIPILGDQWFNAEKYVKLGIGMKLDAETVTEEEFKTAVETVIGNDSYRQNIVKLRTFMEDQPEPPLQRTMWWIEYVIRHGGAKQLRAPAANISNYEYFVVDVLLVVVSTILISLILTSIAIVIIVRLISKFLFGKKKLKTN